MAALLDHYLLSLDDEELTESWAHALFSEQARVEFPHSRHDGREGIAEYHRRALARFQRTQHLGSPAVIEIAGDHARLRANLISTHVLIPADPRADAQPPLFVTGTLVTGEASRTPAGWRLDLLSFRLVWATGGPPRNGG